MSHWRGGIKRDKTDVVYSYLIRERSFWICDYCHQDFKHDTGKLHCSHIYGRRKKGVRWHPYNALAHCYKCHARLEENPPEMTAHAKRKLGSKFAMLEGLAGRPTKFTPFDKEIIHKHFLAEKKRMLKKRAEGFQGRIDFTMYPQGATA